MADAVVIGLARKVKKVAPSKEEDATGEDDDEGMSLEEAEDDAVDELMAAFDEGDKGKAKAALRDFVTACVKRQEKGDY